jgi:hypothetical protein
MPYVVCLIGPDSLEKDRILNKLALALEQKGLKTGVLIKNQRPADQTPDTLELSENGIMLKAGPSPKTLPQLLEAFFPSHDLVLTTAHDQAKKAKLELVLSNEPSPDPGVRAYICESPIQSEKPTYKPAALADLAEFIAREVMPAKEPARVRILLSGERIPIKGFVQDIIANAIRAMVASLRSGDKPGRLEVFIDK